MSLSFVVVVVFDDDDDKVLLIGLVFFFIDHNLFVMFIMVVDGFPYCCNYCY